MNIKIPKKRAAEIMKEEIEKFLQENKNVDRKLLEEFLNKGERK
jgi:O-acetyl-ADP-ribose deacetylase (regulator of RNase III)